MMVVCFLAVLFVVGCGGSDHGDEVMPAQCVPGEMNLCMCASGGQGYQVCEADGRSFGKCDCPTVEHDAGTPDEAATDSAVPEASPEATPDANGPEASTQACPETLPAAECPDGWYECTAMALADIQNGSLIKGTGPAVYYLALDGTRFVFPNTQTYRSWFPQGADCPAIHDISDIDLASVAIGGNVCYKPGVRLLKITTDPKVYAVSQGCVLRWIESESLISQLYGADWKYLVDDIPDVFFVNYTIGQSIAAPGDYSPFNEKEAATSVEYGIPNY